MHDNDIDPFETFMDADAPDSFYWWLSIITIAGIVLAGVLVLMALKFFEVLT